MPVADGDVFLEKIDPTVIVVLWKFVSWINVAYSAAIADKSLRIITCSSIYFPIIDTGRGIGVEIMIVACIESFEFEHLECVSFFTISASIYGIIVEISGFH